MELSHNKRMELLIDVASKLKSQRNIMVIQDLFKDDKIAFVDSKKIISQNGKLNINLYLFDDKNGKIGFSIIDNVDKECYLYNEKKIEKRKSYNKEILIYRQSKNYRHNIKFAFDEGTNDYILINAELTDLENNEHKKIFTKLGKIEEKDIALLAQLEDAEERLNKYECLADDYFNNGGDKKIFERNIRELEIAEQRLAIIRENILGRYEFKSNKQETQEDNFVYEKGNFLMESDDEVEVSKYEATEVKRAVVDIYLYANKLIKSISENSKSER